MENRLFYNAPRKMAAELKPVYLLKVYGYKGICSIGKEAIMASGVAQKCYKKGFGIPEKFTVTEKDDNGSYEVNLTAELQDKIYLGGDYQKMYNVVVNALLARFSTDAYDADDGIEMVYLLDDWTPKMK